MFHKLYNYILFGECFLGNYLLYVLQTVYIVSEIALFLFILQTVSTGAH